MSDHATTSRRSFVNPWLLVPLVVFLGLAGLFGARIGHDPGVLPSPLIGREAPAFVLPALEGLTRDGDAIAAFPMPI